MRKATINDIVYLMNGSSIHKTVRIYEVFGDEAYGKSTTDNSKWKIFSLGIDGEEKAWWSGSYQKLEDELPNVNKVTIEVEIPSGYEFVRFGLPKKNELFVTNGIVRTCNNEEWTYCELVIVKKSWVKPDFLKKGWIAKDKDGVWFWFINKPRLELNNQSWRSFYATLDLRYVNWTPPEVDWENSLIEV